MRETKLKISVVTISFNAEATIADTLRSVAVQDWPDVEHLIIDGASRDSTLAVISANSHDRLLVLSEPDGGLYNAMNKGLRLANGDIVGFLNSDDFLARTDALSLVARAFSDDIDCVGGQIAVVARDAISTVRQRYRAEGFRPWMLRFGHMPPHPSFYARRDVLLQAGGFDEAYRTSADFDLMIKLFLHQKINFKAIPETITGFRDGGASTKDLSAKLNINKDIKSALIANGYSGSNAFLWSRYPLKALQLLGRPKDYSSLAKDLSLPNWPKS